MFERVGWVSLYRNAFEKLIALLILSQFGKQKFGNIWF